MKYLLTGDTHTQVIERLLNIEKYYPKNETALIILGDVGLNVWLDEGDRNNKKAVNDFGYIIYCVRGNHEEHPKNIATMDTWYDDDIMQLVRREPEFPNIRYLIDGYIYYFNNYRTLVVGGAYSIDKYYRLQTNAPWFKDEQLTTEEMTAISFCHYNEKFDFVLSHTCPISWEPKDLFINGIDQSTVDKTMEKWLEEFKDTISWRVWCFGHFHDDRLVRPRVEMFYFDIDEMDTLYKRWTNGKEIDWWLKKDPNYYME